MLFNGGWRHWWLKSLIILSTCNSGTTEIYAEESQATKSVPYRCEIYNGSLCTDVFRNNRWVYIDKPVARIEKRLQKWFKTNKETGQITKECWQHAKALTCAHYYPECNSAKNGLSSRRSLCSQHCRFMTQKVCRGEFRRSRISERFRQFLPLCEEVSLVDDSDGHNCFFLPTVNFSKAPEPFAASEKRYSRELGKTAVLKCIFGIRNFVWRQSNSEMITEGTWYFKGRRIVGSRRMITKTQQKGSTRLFMQLKIRQVSLKDDGVYKCVITFANKTVRTTAQLSVYQDTQTKVTRIEGKCVNYNDGYCSQFFSNGAQLFEKFHHPLSIVGGQIETLIKRLTNSGKLSQKCLKFGQPVLCYHKFQQCEINKPVPSLCKRDCELFKQKYCRDELFLIRSISWLNMYIPDCNTLTDNNDKCLPIEVPKPAMPCISIGDSIGDYQGTMSVTTTGVPCDPWNLHGYPNVTHNYCRNYGDATSAWCYAQGQRQPCDVSCREQCYADKGLDYHGTVSTSTSGRKCLAWNAVMPYHYSNVDHEYCRNIEGDMSAPWCYVDAVTREKELCDVPKCIQTALKSGPSSLIVYVVPSIIGGTAILFSFFIFLFCVKRRKIIEGSRAEHMSQESVSIDKTFPPLLAPSSFHTMSTTASLEFTKDPPPQCDLQASYSPLISGRKTNRPRVRIVPEVKENQLYRLEKIGDGKLGQLWQGEFVADRHNVIPIVVRKLKPDTRTCVASAFRTEMNALRHTRHPHIQPVVCVSALSEIPFIAFEDRCRLDLKEFLKGNDYTDVGCLLDHIIQIANGLQYLHSQNILHKDLAARNIIIYPHGNVQISKSGLGMYRYPNDYKHLPGLGLSPVRWLSPGCLETGAYKAVTDVYMFGVLIWETFSLGSQPYGTCENDDEVIEQIIKGGKLACPVLCPSFVWDVAMQCMATAVEERPSVAAIREILEAKGPILHQVPDVVLT